MLVLSVWWPQILRLTVLVSSLYQMTGPCLVQSTYADQALSTLMYGALTFLIYGFPTKLDAVLLMLFPASRFFSPIIETQAGTLAKLCLYCAAVMAGLTLMVVTSFWFVSQNVRLNGTIRRKVQINQSIINSVPVGIIGVRPAARTQDEARKTYMADPEEPSGSLPKAGRFLLKFSNVLADKMFLEASPPQSKSSLQLAAKKTRKNQSLAISTQDLDKRIFRPYR